MKPSKTSNHSNRQRKLELRKERVRELGREQLEQVNGAGLPTGACTSTQGVQ